MHAVNLVGFKIQHLALSTDTCENSKLVQRRKRSKVNAAPPRFFLLVFRRVRAASMTQRRVENTRVHFWTSSPVSVKIKLELLVSEHNNVHPKNKPLLNFVISIYPLKIFSNTVCPFYNI